MSEALLAVGESLRVGIIGGGRYQACRLVNFARLVKKGNAKPTPLIVCFGSVACTTSVTASPSSAEACQT